MACVAQVPLAGSVQGVCLVRLPVLGRVVGQRVVRVRRGKKGLNTEENRADLKGRAPLVLKDVKANAAQLVDVRMVDFGQKAHLGGKREGGEKKSPHARV